MRHLRAVAGAVGRGFAIGAGAADGVGAADGGASAAEADGASGSSVVADVADVADGMGGAAASARSATAGGGGAAGADCILRAMKNVTPAIPTAKITVRTGKNQRAGVGGGPMSVLPSSNASVSVSASKETLG